ncbi:MAG TPA: LD-carboxypeptidase [Deltaproteobacteria bacterium]|nr:LD-carboxypeptidase [Deltaproteobacteria bacterium]
MPPSESRRLPPLKPPRLRPGDQIGVVSPAGPVSESQLKPGLDLLRSRGFRLRVAPHVYDRRKYLAGDDGDRVSDLHQMFLDRETKAIFCTRGGYGTLRLLQRLDYDLVRDHPKIIVGYSDITALLMAINRMTGLITFHGPMVRGLSGLEGDSLERLLAMVSGADPVRLGPMGGISLIPGRTSGPLMGGNLSLICHLTGTPFFPSLEGSILFVEDRGEPLYRIDRMLTHLVLTGRLKGIVGLMGGEFVECGDSSAVDYLLMTVASDLNIPLATRIPAGHGPVNLALPLGIPVSFDTASMTLSLQESCVV